MTRTTPPRKTTVATTAVAIQIRQTPADRLARIRGIAAAQKRRKELAK